MQSMGHEDGRFEGVLGRRIRHASSFGEARPRRDKGAWLWSTAFLRRREDQSHESPRRASGFDNLLRPVLDAVPLALVLVDDVDRIVVANGVAEHLFGYPADGLLGVPFDTLVPRDAGSEESPQALLATRADGSQWAIDLHSHAVRFGGHVATLLVVHDAALRQRAEREAARQRDELAHLSRVAMLGEISGALAHELNQPLSAILSNAQAAQRLMRHESPDLTEVGDILGDIVADDRRASDIIQRLRKWLRKDNAEHEPLGVNGLVLDVLHLVRRDLQRRGVDVQLELAGELTLIAGDRIQLQQVLLNLMLNGCDAMAGSTQRVLRVRTTACERGARVEVNDRGAGIAPEILHTMFEPFETTKPDGMGMGLAVCRTIVDAHGGRIWATNAPGGGACVAFDLPGAPR